MASDLRLDRLATHYINIEADRVDYATEEQDVSALDQRILDFFVDLAGEVWDAGDSGDVSSARFNFPGDAHTAIADAIQCILDIQTASGDFFQTSKQLAHLLHQVTPRTASPGLLAVTRITSLASGNVHVALLKIRHKDQDFVRVLDTALTQLQVEHVQKMLIPEILKGAISPHPERSEYDLKLIDKQVKGIEPAKYFKDFLRCTVKPSDEHQLKTLLPAVRQYASARKLPVREDKLHRIISDLRSRDQNVTTKAVAEALQENGVLGRTFDEADFQRYINEESALGQIDIPIEHFAQNITASGQKRKRKLVYKFSMEPYKDLVISGPPEVFDHVITRERDKIVFRIETTREGYEDFYE